MFKSMTPSPSLPTAYVSAQSRARVATILLIAGAVVSALLILAELAQLLFSPYAEGEALETNPGGFAALFSYLALTFVGFLVFVATVVVFLMWVHRSSRNLASFGWRSQGHSPSWAVGSYFVPIANLFMPYQAMKEIWLKSRPARSQPFSFSNSPPGILPAWWAFWLTSNFATNIHFRLSGGEVRELAIIFGILSELLSIAAAAFAIQVIKEITRRQEETILHVSEEQFPMPPPPPVFQPSVAPTESGRYLAKRPRSK
jgi:uncharacterized protein DUF4328